MRLAMVQAVSGVVFAVFLALHLATTSSAAGGAALYDGVLAALRRVYRPTLAVELLLIGVPAVVHIACAVLALLARRGTRAPRSPLRVRVHRATGYVLLVAIGGHVFATRVMPALATGATATGAADFSYLAYSLLNWPGFMRPYYLVFGVAGAIHLALGLGVATQVLFGRRGPAMATVGRVSVAAAVVAGVLVAAGVSRMIVGAGQASVARFAEFRALYERFMPFLPPRL